MALSSDIKLTVILFGYVEIFKEIFHFISPKISVFLMSKMKIQKITLSHSEIAYGIN